MADYVAGRIGIAAGSLMVKWNILNRHVVGHPIRIGKDDRVNVFINLEGVLKNLSMMKDLTGSIVYHKQKIVIELESAILNLMANYRMYFKKEQSFPRMFFYFTDLTDESQQEMEMYNPRYRTYYRNRYLQNPQFRDMGNLMRDIIIPEVRLILQYVPECYLISTGNFDGSIIPLAVSDILDGKNVIVSSDIFDTLYLFYPNFLTLYVKRRFQDLKVSSEIDDTVQSIIKGESPFDLTIFNSEMYYRLLLAIKGSRIRNIKSAKGFGYGKFMQILKKGIEQGVVLKDFGSLDSIIQLFPPEYREDTKVAFQCTSLDIHKALLNDTDIEGIKAQIVDKVDIKSLEALNNRRFLEAPINLQGLIGS